MALDLFDEINNAVRDLQLAQLQTYERPLKKLAHLLKHIELKPYNDALTADLDLDAFIEEGLQTGSSFVGSKRLVWPAETKKYLGLTFLLIEKFGDAPEYASDFSYHFYYSKSNLLASIQSLISQLIIPFVRDYRTYVQAEGRIQKILKGPLSRKVFIVHGHDNGARELVAGFLERIGLEAIILHEQPNQGRTVIEKVVAHGDVGFAVVLLTPDDEGCVKGGTPAARPRQNVLLELGYFIGRLGRDKICALKRGELEIPSDFAGVIWDQMDDSGKWKARIACELEAVGHAIDWSKVSRF